MVIQFTSQTATAIKNELFNRKISHLKTDQDLTKGQLVDLLNIFKTWPDEIFPEGKWNTIQLIENQMEKFYTGNDIDK